MRRTRWTLAAPSRQPDSCLGHRAGERLMVCVGPDAQAEKLVRAGKRMAAALHAQWLLASGRGLIYRVAEKSRRSVPTTLVLQTADVPTSPRQENS